MAFALRPYQQEAVDGVRKAFYQGHKSVVLVAPTGAGKTVVFSHIVDSVEKKGKAVTILVHREELVTQCSLSLAENGLRHRLIVPHQLQRSVMRDHIDKYGQNYLHPATDVVVASVQTLARNFDKLPAPDLIVTDECHHSLAANYLKVYEKYPKARLLGVTATPERLDGKGLGGVYSTMVEAPGTGWMIDNGYLCKPIIYEPDPDFTMDDAPIERGDFKKSASESKVTRKIIGNAVQHYRQICDGVPAIAFCVSVKHAEDVAAEFRAAGYRAIALDGNTNKEIRKGALAALGRGDLDVVASCDLVSEGTDVPLAAAAILLRPSASLTMVMQQCGRVLRLYPNAPIMRKPHMQKLIGPDGTHYAFILDHVGNMRRHGRPHIDRVWSLEGKKAREKQEAPERKCPECSKWHPVYLKVCPYCSHDYLLEREGEEGQGSARVIEQVEGRLIEISETPNWAGGLNIRTSPYREVLAMAKTREHFQQIASARGYRQQWAYINHKIFMERGGAHVSQNQNH